jgi:hypothetical protein
MAQSCAQLSLEPELEPQPSLEPELHPSEPVLSPEQPLDPSLLLQLSELVLSDVELQLSPDVELSPEQPLGEVS